MKGKPSRSDWTAKTPRRDGRRRQRRPGAGPSGCRLCHWHGTDVAIEAADVTLVGGSLRGVVTAIEVLRRRRTSSRISLAPFSITCLAFLSRPVCSIRSSASCSRDDCRCRDGGVKYYGRHSESAPVLYAEARSGDTPMNTINMLVTIVGLSVIGWIVWYFWLWKGDVSPQRCTPGKQEVM